MPALYGTSDIFGTDAGELHERNLKPALQRVIAVDGDGQNFGTTGLLVDMVAALGTAQLPAARLGSRAKCLPETRLHTAISNTRTVLS